MEDTVHLEKRIKINGQTIRYESTPQCGIVPTAKTVRATSKHLITCGHCLRRLKCSKD